MTGSFPSRIGAETIGLMKQNRYFYESLLGVKKEIPGSTLKVKISDTAARSETRQLENGDLEVVYTYPIDNNKNREDGRLWVIDRFVFDGKDKSLRTFNFDRQVEYNQLGNNKAEWRQVRDRYRQAVLPNAEQQKNFVDAVVHSYSRPFLTEHKDALGKQVKSELAERKKLQASETAWDPRKLYFLSIAGKAGKMGLKLLSRDPRNRYTIIQRQHSYDLIISYVVEDKDPNTKGHLYVQDRFTFMGTNDPVAMSREVIVATGSPKEEGWEAKRQAFYGSDGKLRNELMPEFEAAEKFVAPLKDSMLSKLPDFTAWGALKEKQEPAGGYIELTPAIFDQTLSRGADRALSWDIDDYSPYKELNPQSGKIEQITARQLLQANGAYFSTLQAAIGTQVPWDLQEFPLRVVVSIQGDTTKLKLIHEIGEPGFDNVSRGKIQFTETFEFVGKQLTGIERDVVRNGADPEAKLEMVRTAIQASIDQKLFPAANSGVAQRLTGLLTLTLAPHLMEVPGQKPLLERAGIELSQEQRETLELFKNLEKSLRPLLHHPNVDPKVRVPLLRALVSIQYGDDQGVQTDLQEFIQSQSLALQQNSGAGKDRVEDYLKLAKVIQTIMTQQWDVAAEVAKLPKSPALREILTGLIAPKLRRHRNQEGFLVLENIIQNKLQLQDIESDTWIGGGDFDLKASEQALRSLMSKAKAQGQSSDANSPFKVLAELTELTTAEDKLRGEILKDPLYRKLNNIAQETNRQIQGRDYFQVASHALMDAKLVSAATWLAEYVTLNHLPKTASLEGIAVLDKFAQTRLGVEVAKVLAAKQGPKSKWVQMLSDPQSLTTMKPEAREAFVLKMLQAYESYLSEAPELKNNLDYDEAVFVSKNGPAFFDKVALLTQAQPDAKLQDVLVGMKDLSEAEQYLQKKLLNDPRFQSLFKAGDAGDATKRLEAYNKALAPLSQDPEFAPVLAKFESIVTKSGGFPQRRALQEQFLLMFLVLYGANERIKAHSLTAIAPKLQQDALAEQQALEKEVKPELELKTEAQARLLQKARQLAASRPTASPDELLKLITPEGLAKELTDYKASIKDPSVEQQATFTRTEKIHAEMIAERDRILKDPMVQKLTTIVGEADPFKRFKAYEGLFQETLGILGMQEELAAMIMEADAKKRGEMSTDLLKKAGSDGSLKQLITGVAAESDQQKRIQLFQKLAQELSQQEGAAGKMAMSQPAVLLRQELSTGQLVHLTIADQIKNDPKMDDKIKQQQLAQVKVDTLPARVQDFLALGQGEGSFGLKAEYLTNNFFHEVTKPTTLAAMVAAGYLGPLAEGAGLQLLHKFGVSGRALAVGGWGIGVAAEGTAFTLTHKVGDSAFYSQRGQWDHVGKDIATSILVFGGLKLGHGTVGKFSQDVLATGKLGKWAGGPVKTGELVPKVSPLGRISPTVPLPTGAVPQLTVAGTRFTALLNHGAGVGSMYGANQVAQLTGLQQKSTKSQSDQFMDAVTMYVQAMAMYPLANRLTGGRLQRDVTALRARNQAIVALPNLSKVKVTSDQPALVDAKVLAALGGRHATTERSPGQSAELILREAIEKVIPEQDLAKIESKFEDGDFWVRETVEAKTESTDPSVVLKPESKLIKVDGKNITGNEWVKIAPGATFEGAKGSHQVGKLPEASKITVNPDLVVLLEGLAQVPKEQQLSLARRIAKAKDLKHLESYLDKMPGQGGVILHQALRQVMSGHLSLKHVPRELGFRLKVAELLKVEVEQLENLGFTEAHFTLRDGLLRGDFSKTQRKYLVGLQAKITTQKILEAKDPASVIEVLENSTLASIDGVKIADLSNAIKTGGEGVAAAGIRQKLRDIEAAQEHEVGVKDNQVAEKQDKALVDLVKRHLDDKFEGDYADAQLLLRKAVEGNDPKLASKGRVMLLKGHLKGLRDRHQTSLLDTYLGPKGEREMPSLGKGFEVATLLGRSGLPMDFHLVLRPDAQGKTSVYLVKGKQASGIPVVWSRSVGKGHSAKAEDALWQAAEVESFVEQAKAILSAEATGEASSQVKEIRSVLLHPYGGMEIIVSRSSEGMLAVKMRYSYRFKRNLERPEVQRALDSLTELNIPDAEISLSRDAAKFKDFVSELQHATSLPTWGEIVSGKLPQMPPVSQWIKSKLPKVELPKITLPKWRRNKEASTETGTKDGVKDEAAEPDRTGDPAAADPVPDVDTSGAKAPPIPKSPLPVLPTETQGGAKPKAQGKSKDGVKTGDIIQISSLGSSADAKPDGKTDAPPAPPKKRPPPPPRRKLVPKAQGALKQVPSTLATAQAKRIESEVAARIHDGLGKFIQQKAAAGEVLADGEVVRVDVNAAEVTLRQNDAMLSVDVEFSYDGILEQFKLTTNSAKNIREASSLAVDPVIQEFYQQLLHYEASGVSKDSVNIFEDLTDFDMLKSLDEVLGTED